MYYNAVEEAKSEINEIIMNALGRLVSDGKIPAEPLPPFAVTVPSDNAHGDFSANAALVSAKALGTNPRALGEMIRDTAELKGTLFGKIELAGPGFLNFFLGESWYSSVVQNTLKLGADYGKTELGKGKRVLVEFVSANPTGPMHIGNARGGAIGDCLASLLEEAGYKADREFYVNDAGNQVEKFGKSLDLRYTQICSSAGQALIEEFPDNEKLCREIFDKTVADTEDKPADKNAPFYMPSDVYLGADIIAHAKNYYDKYGKALSEKPEEERKKALVEYALPINEKTLETDLLKYRIKYDNWFKESSLHKSGAVDEVIEHLKKSGHTYEKDGALWLRATDFEGEREQDVRKTAPKGGKDAANKGLSLEQDVRKTAPKGGKDAANKGLSEDFVLVRSNGFPTYIVPDIAYHYNKLVTRNYDKAIDVLGADHHGYVKRMRICLKAMGIDDKRLDAVICQMVMLVSEGKPVKLSKRSGKAITLATLLDEVPIDNARFFFNLRDANTHLDFDLDLAVEESSKNPVYYVQYAHARICRVLEKQAEDGAVYSGQPVNYTADEEKALIRKIAEYPELINEAAKEYSPFKLTKYVYELAQIFHKFYDVCGIKDAETSVKLSRLALCEAAKTVIKNVLTLLKIDAPEKM